MAGDTVRPGDPRTGRGLGVKLTTFEPPNTLRCTRCAYTMTLRVPINIKALELYLQAFSLEHRECIEGQK